MTRMLCSCLFWIFASTFLVNAEHVIVCGGPALKKWESYRIQEDQHDRWWANFVRASTIKMDLLRKEHGEKASLVWLVYRSGYTLRGQEDGNPYTVWIEGQAKKRKAKLIWFDTSGEFIKSMNSLPRRSVKSFDYFGHSNKNAFLFEYGGEVLGVSTCFFHQRDIRSIQRSIFAKHAECKSWGCHTGASMSAVWKKHINQPLEGAIGKTLYTVVGEGKLPLGFGGWAR